MASCLFVYQSFEILTSLHISASVKYSKLSKQSLQIPGFQEMTWSFQDIASQFASLQEMTWPIEYTALAEQFSHFLAIVSYLVTSSLESIAGDLSQQYIHSWLTRVLHSDKSAINILQTAFCVVISFWCYSVNWWSNSNYVSLVRLDMSEINAWICWNNDLLK